MNVRGIVVFLPQRDPEVGKTIFGRHIEII